MKNPEKEAYAKYLTERLDNNQSQNIVIPTTIDLITNKVDLNNSARVMDIGCFSGAMLDRVRRELPAAIRERVEFCGVDMDQEALILGKSKYPDLNLYSGEIHENLEQLGAFDIIIMSNIIHEAISGDLESNNENAVIEVIGNVSKLLNPNGILIILDGLRPESDQTIIAVDFANQTSNIFELFATEYKAFPIYFKKPSDGKYQMRLKDLAAFLTKARYLKEDYWPIEAPQLYQLNPFQNSVFG